MKTITVNDKMQKNYTYTLTCPVGKKMDFNPYYSPREMLEMGVFEGKYCRDCKDEFPKSWFTNAKESKTDAGDPSLNYFKIKSRQSLQIWQQKHWIIDPDVRGWFQWYMRYYMGRRIPDVDEKQIKRYNAIARHAGQVLKNCHHKGKDGRCTDPFHCRPKQRQALLQWAHDCLI